jgi:hypothetical protein
VWNTMEKNPGEMVKRKRASYDIKSWDSSCKQWRDWRTLCRGKNCTISSNFRNKSPEDLSEGEMERAGYASREHWGATYLYSVISQLNGPGRGLKLITIPSLRIWNEEQES